MRTETEVFFAALEKAAAPQWVRSSQQAPGVRAPEGAWVRRGVPKLKNTLGRETLGAPKTVSSVTRTPTGYTHYKYKTR
jgi:hypothetical protein